MVERIQKRRNNPLVECSVEVLRLGEKIRAECDNEIRAGVPIRSEIGVLKLSGLLSSLPSEAFKLWAARPHNGARRLLLMKI